MLREKGKKCRQGEIFLVFYVSLFLVFYGLVGFLWFLIVFFLGGVKRNRKRRNPGRTTKAGHKWTTEGTFPGRLVTQGGREGTDTKTNE